MALGSRVRYYRKLNGLTQRQLAEKAGVHYPRVAEIESGRSKSQRMAAKLLYAMGLKVHSFIIPIDQEYRLIRMPSPSNT